MNKIRIFSQKGIIITLAAIVTMGALVAMRGSAGLAVGETVIDAPIVADTYTATGNATLNATNYGTKPYAFATSGSNTGFLRFNTSAPAPAGMVLDSATIELRTTNLTTTAGGYVIHQVADTWSENTLTYNNQPALGAALGTSPTPAASPNYGYTSL